MRAKLCLVVGAMVASLTGGHAAISLWTGTWNSVGGAAVSDNVGDCSYSDFDIVGDSSYPAVQYAQDNSGVYLRVQVASATLPTTPNGSYMFYIDLVGTGTTDRPDFAFAMDYKGTPSSNHLLEMTKYSSGSTWATLTMDDVDGSNNGKGVQDIGYRSGDGAFGIVQATGVGGTTRSYVSIAVSWEYLENYSTTGLGRGQTWRVAAGTIYNQTDHSSIAPNGDIVGIAGLGSTPFTGGWSGEFTTVPEVPAAAWFAPALMGLIGIRWIRCRVRNH